MPVTLNISNQNVKLVYSRGNTIEKWETVSFSPGLIKDGQILQPEEFANVIKSLFKNLRLPDTQVVVSIEGTPFIYRILTLPHVKPTMQQEAIERAGQKEINVPLDELYFDWQIISDTGKEIEVFILGAPRGIVDGLVQVMGLAKVRLAAMDLKPLALARMVDLAEALIVNFEKEGSDIIIVSKGIPVTLHTVASKSKNASLEDNLLQLVDELTRTVEFFNLTHKDSPILPETPIISRELWLASRPPEILSAIILDIPLAP